MCHLWRMKNCWHYCSQVPPLAPKQITAEFLGRKEHICEDRPFPPYPVLSRQSSCEVISMWLDVDKGCFTDMEIMLIACEWGWGKNFSDREKNTSKLRGRSKLFGARQESWCVSTPKVFIRRNGKEGRTDGLGYVSMVLNQNREHAIKVSGLTNHDHILCCLNQGKFKGEHGCWYQWY